MGRWSIVASLLVSGCFHPSPPEGALCSETLQCPPGQSCGEDGICRSEPIDIPDGADPDGESRDGGRQDSGGPAKFAMICTSDVDCSGTGADLLCFLGGPGGDPTRGFCSHPCSGDTDCADLGTGLVCFFGAAGEACSIPCSGNSCPSDFECVGSAAICDLPGPAGPDGGVPDSGVPDSGVIDAGSPSSDAAPPPD